MLDGNHRRHAVSHIRSGEIRILFLQNVQLSRVGVDDARKHGLEAGQMGSAFCVIDIVAEAQHVFVKFIHVLEGALHRNSFALPGKIDHIAHRLPGFVQVADEAHDSLRLVIFDHLRLLFSFVRKHNGERRVQIGRLMQAALDLILFKAGLFKNGIVRQKVDAGSRIPGLAHHGKKAVHQLHRRDTALVPVLINLSVMPHAHGHPGGKGVHHGGTHAMQAAAGFIGGMIEFTSRMQGGKHQPFRAHPFFMHSHRNASSVIVHGGGAVRLQRHADLIAHTCQMLIHRIVYNLINQMIESLRGNASDIHARSLADRLKSLQHRNAGSIVSVLTAHSTLLFQLIPNAGCLAKKIRQTAGKQRREATLCVPFPPFITLSFRFSRSAS